MNQVFLGTYKENEFETLMNIAQLIRSKGYRTTQIEQYEDDEYVSVVCIYFKNTKEEVLELMLDEGSDDIELSGDDIMFMTNVVFAEVNKVKENSKINKSDALYKECLDNVKKQRGVYPYNGSSNYLKGDGYFCSHIRSKYPEEYIIAAVNECEEIEKR